VNNRILLAMITMDDLMSCGSGGDGHQVATPRRQMMAVGDHQLTVSRIRAAVSMLGLRTGHARFRRGPVAVSDGHPPPSSDHHHQQQLASGSAALGFVNKGCDEAAPSASASGGSSSLPSTTTLTSLTAGGEGSVSNGRVHGSFPPLMSGQAAGKAISMQQQPAASDYYAASGGAALRSKSHGGRARSENDAGGKAAHAGRCHCSKKRYALIKLLHYFFLTSIDY